MYIEDCLYLLDGRFNQLRTFYVNIEFSSPSSMLKIIGVCFYPPLISALSSILKKNEIVVGISYAKTR